MFRCRLTSLWLGLYVIVGLFSTRPVSAQIAYQITDLGLFGGIFSQATGINDRGQIVGYYGTKNSQIHAFLWDSTQGFVDIGTAGGQQGNATGINNKGEVAGWGLNAAGLERAFFWSQARGLKDIGTLREGGVGTAYAFAINDRSQVVGDADASIGPVEPAFIWDSQHGMQSLGTLGGSFSGALGINNHGQVTGYSYTRDPNSIVHAFVWDNGNLKDLGTLPGGNSSWGNGINDAGQVVGAAMTSSGYNHAILWDSTQGMRELGTLANYPVSVAVAINNQGTIIGYSSIPFDESVPVIWQNDSLRKLQDLIPADSGLLLNFVYDINERGQIVGSASVINGTRFQYHAVLLTPVPEPDSPAYLLSLTLLSIFLLRCRRKVKRIAGSNCSCHP